MKDASKDDVDPGLARRLAALHPDVPDDGFTASVMARLPAQIPAAPVRPPRSVRETGGEETPLLVVTLVAVLAICLGVVMGGADAGRLDVLAGVDVAGSADAAGRWLGAQLTALLDGYLTWLVAGVAALVAMAMPALLEDG